MTGLVSVIIPASNEGQYIGTCLKAVLASRPLPQHGLEVVVVANGCRDDTATIAQGFTAMAQSRGWSLHVLDLPEGGKIRALNAGEQRASGHIRVYLDADVVVSPDLLAELASALSVDQPRYAAGTAQIPAPASWVTARYARFWQRLPFARMQAAGFGLFAVNAAGRQRWGQFPDIISDDTFVRLQFTPQERMQVNARYDWPMTEGLARLVRVRRRQDQGTAQLAALFPALMQNEDKPHPDFLALLKADPVGFCVYGFVSVIVRLTRKRDSTHWARGR
ncbi:glycosyltransferase [Roseinatronobacter alkalisoli]|uniref:Glycosyltransferase n=1 Tax=Roseinatronobacter alkalisoli TaxID=3028235 RepID=A0ABT5T8X9_9RHOB|nr:glycosyltransferase [Roseinatronobacter sp. HJB301]MDD7971573.1 glycosyltransferase [Roseinatronobacter sp. HJB301]